MGFNFRQVSKEDVFPYISDFCNKCHGAYQIENICKSNVRKEFCVYGMGNCGEYYNVPFEHYLRFIEYMGTLYLFFIPKYKNEIEAIYCVGNPNEMAFPQQVPEIAEAIYRTLPAYQESKRFEAQFPNYIE